MTDRSQTFVAQHLDISVPTADTRRRRQLLSGVTITIAPGEIVGLTGPSGSGKSALIRVLSGLDVPDEGEITLVGAPVTDLRKATDSPTRGRIGVIFQSPRSALDPRLSLEKSIALAHKAAHKRGRTSPSDSQILDRTTFADSIGLTKELLARRPAEVSDGQLQRAALVRTLAHHPDVILCDEITAALDPISAATVMTALRQYSRVFGKAVLVVSHDHGLVNAIADRVERIDDWRVDTRVTRPSDDHESLS